MQPERWFFDGHFHGDPVVPGCLGLDALWQLLGFFLAWQGHREPGRAFGSGVFLFMGGKEWLGLGDSALYNAGFSLALLWFIIGANVIGLERGKWIQNVGALCTGAVFVILAIAGIWAWTQFGSATDFAARPLLPDFANYATLLSVVLALIPPPGTEHPVMFVLKVGGGCLLFLVIGLLFYYRNRR